MQQWGDKTKRESTHLEPNKHCWNGTWTSASAAYLSELSLPLACSSCIHSSGRGRGQNKWVCHTYSMGMANLWTESVSCCGQTNKNRESSHIVKLKEWGNYSHTIRQNYKTTKNLPQLPKLWGGCNMGKEGR